MTHFICCQCGTQYADRDLAPSGCAICDDERQYVRWSGQAWTTLEELQQNHRVRWEEEGDGLAGIGTAPSFAIGQRALLVESDFGNVLWDCIAFIDGDIVQRVNARGGLKAIAISHPHYYTTMVAWSEAFGGVPIYLHESDREWVQRPHHAIVYWSGDVHAISATLTLIRCGGHFPGGTVLHWSEGAYGKGALLSGDVLQVTQDRRHVSFMLSYPNYIPLGVRSIEHIRNVLSPYAFDSIYGAWWKQNIIGHGRAAFEASVSRYLAAIDA